MGRRAATQEQKTINKRQRDRRRAANPDAAEKKRQKNRDRYQRQRQLAQGRRTEAPLTSSDPRPNDLRLENSIERQRRRLRVDEPDTNTESRGEEDEEEEGPCFDDVANSCIQSAILVESSRRLMLLDPGDGGDEISESDLDSSDSSEGARCDHTILIH